MNIINEIDRFFASINSYINYNGIFITFSLLFLFAVLIVIISTANSYETKLIKAVDKFNKYFINNPNIDENNLLAFNNRMKARRVPKQLRKQWQQFVLYREHKASHYMSFENCVAAPLRNSTFKRDVNAFNIFSYILALACLILNLSFATYYEGITLTSGNFPAFLQHILLCPILILILNFLFRIMFDFRHNAIVDDLYQNYQYFEVNIDKATETLPDYVDYEVLFDKNEIKRGIPILYIYLQKRAEEEKRELERARLKNIEHEQFNFDESGVESSLVLERAMQEAENYIAERKKFMQDIEQVNSEITQEEVNFREITKEYQRQMQVSKESFDNFKSQLEEANSTIEANYLKKQQQQELDRQRNLERDYDTATERHNKLLQSLQGEIDNFNQQIKNAKNTLEKGMMSEFDTYSSKVYNAAKQAVQEREKTLVDEVNDLRSKLNIETRETVTETNEPAQETVSNPVAEVSQTNEPAQEFDYGQFYKSQNIPEPEVNSETNVNLTETNEVAQEQESSTIQENESTTKPLAKRGRPKGSTKAAAQNKKGRGRPAKAEVKEEVEKTKGRGRPKKVETTATEAPKKGRGRPKKEATTETNNVEAKKGRGRPAKAEVNEEVAKTKGRGRPKKAETSATEAPKKGRGRPKKEAEVETNKVEVKKGRGRPAKVEVKEEVAKTKGRGRPKKAETTVTEAPKKGRGRPAKASEVNSDVKGGSAVNNYNVLNIDNENIEDIDAYLQEIDNQIKIENEKMKVSERELAKNSRLRKKR